MVPRLPAAASTIIAFMLLAPPLAVRTGAQTPGASPEAAGLAQGRALLAQGNTARASATAKTLIAQFPKSPAVLEFAVEAEVAFSGAAAGRGTYERWATANGREHAPALHTVARAMLGEAAKSTLGATMKVLVLEALAGDGDRQAAATLASDALQQETGPGPLAPTGNDRAIVALLAELGDPMANRKRAIVALGASRSTRAVDPLITLLSDPNPDVRAAAADALGKLGASRAILPLKGLLEDPVFPVHYQAAAALFALNDLSGLSWLRQLETSPEPGIRLAAAQATRNRPDAAWIALVRGLASGPDAEVRRQAAVLLAPHDPQAAREALKPLLSDPNVAERDAATGSYIETAETDLATLRRYWGAGNPDTRLRAAMRLLNLTR